VSSQKLLQKGSASNFKEEVEKRWFDVYRQGVTIPSQIRYVQYYGQIISKQLQYEGVVLLLRAIKLEGIPTFSGGVCSECFHG